MYCKKNPEWMEHLDFVIFDLLSIFMAVVLVQLGRGMGDVLLTEQYISYVWIILLADLLSIFFVRPYVHIIQRDAWREFTALVKHFLVVYGIWVVTIYLQHDADMLPRLSFGLSFILAIAFAFLLRQTNKNSVRKILSKSERMRETMVISDAEHLADTLSQLQKKKYNDVRVCAINLRSNQLTQQIQDIISNPPPVDVTFGTDAAIEYLRSHIVDEVVIDQYEDGETDWEDLIFRLLAMGQVVHVSIGRSQNKYPNVTVDQYGSRYVMTTTINTAYHWQLMVKRGIDICGALVGLVLTGIAAIFIVPALKIADPGPVIFSQKRVGKNGRTFNFYKFRSMYMDAEARKAELMAQNEMSGLMFKMENDPRIIGSEKGPGKGIGNFIRRTSLDELPQFWNILRGDMSLVGTRPPTVGEYEQYEPHHKIRLSMQPGLTGMWQVSGRSDITDFEEVVRLDTEYIENWSLAEDVRIIAETVKVVAMGKGSK